jgi:hypothetical protein
VAGCQIDQRFRFELPQATRQGPRVTQSAPDLEVERLIDQAGTAQEILDRRGLRLRDAVGQQDAAMMGIRPSDRLEARQCDNGVTETADPEDQQIWLLLSAH